MEGPLDVVSIGSPRYIRSSTTWAHPPISPCPRAKHKPKPFSKLPLPGALRTINEALHQPARKLALRPVAPPPNLPHTYFQGVVLVTVYAYGGPVPGFESFTTPRGLPSLNRPALRRKGQGCLLRARGRTSIPDAEDRIRTPRIAIRILETRNIPEKAHHLP